MKSRRDVIKTLALSFGGGLLNTYSWKGEHEEKELLLPDSDFQIPKIIKAITLGAGARGNVYGDYSITYPGRLQIIGVAEPIAERNNRYCQKHSIDEKNRFESWEQVFTRPKFADAVIITTPDDLHYAPCMKALEMGYDVLLEKPIAPTEKECRDILKKTKETGRILSLIHI